MIDAVTISAIGGICATAGTIINGWFNYRIRMATLELHDCLDEHRQHTREAFTDLKATTLALHAENQTVLPEKIVDGVKDVMK